MRGYLVDTNIVLRLLTEDDPVQTPAVKEFFVQLVSRKERGYLTTVVVLELVWTLESYFGLPRDEVAADLSLLINTPGLDIENNSAVEAALEYYSSTKADFADCYNAAYAAAHGNGTVLSCDHHFDRLDGVKRIEP